MLNGRKIVVVLPAYNAAKTLNRTYAELPLEILDGVVLVDDASADDTADRARALGITRVVRLDRNVGYGGNQKRCYREALGLGADVVVMVHPDYQYSPRLVVALSAMIAYGEYDVVLGSRILAGGTRGAGMPLYKYVANRALTFAENVLLGAKLSEYHTGLRAYAREVLATLPIGENSDDFVFDNQILAQTLRFGFRIGELSCPARYLADASSIGFRRSVVYGCGVMATAFAYRAQALHLGRFRIFDPAGRRLDPPA